MIPFSKNKKREEKTMNDSVKRTYLTPVALIQSTVDADIISTSAPVYGSGSESNDLFIDAVNIFKN